MYHTVLASLTSHIAHLHLAVVEIQYDPLPNHGDDVPSAMLANGLQIVFGTMGAVALLVIVISGLRYVLAAGDPGKMSQAKMAILYALIGLAISLAAFSLVAFVVKGVA